MSTFRTTDADQTKAIGKKVLYDPTLSLKAKGLIAFALTQPDAADITLKYIQNHNKDGASAIRSAIEELQEAGYVKMMEMRDAHNNYLGKKFAYSDDPSLIENVEQVIIPK